MAVFKIAFIGDPNKNGICDVIENWKKEKNSSIELVNINQKTSLEILAEGDFQGVLYYNDIHNNEEYVSKLEEILSAQSDIKDINVFALTDEVIGKESVNKEKEFLKPIYEKTFSNVDDIEVNFASVNEKHEIESYLSGVVNTISEVYLNKAEEVEQSSEGILDKLVELVIDATEQKHDYTAGHVTRVSKYTEAIAKEMGFPEKDIKGVTLSAKLHDIGKIVVKDSILAKPSDLEKEEKIEMGEHTEQGVGILKTVISRDPKLSEIITPEVIRGVGYHHKEWDGLHGQRDLPEEEQKADPINKEKIGPYALTIVVADCLDAMTSQRAYNNPKHILDVFRDFWENQNKQFNPQIAQSLLLVLSKEIAQLGIAPTEIVPEYPINQDDSKLNNYQKKLKKIDTELKSFLSEHQNEFDINDKAEVGVYSKLGFRLDDTGHLEFEGKYQPARNLNIPYKDKSEFKFISEIKFILIDEAVKNGEDKKIAEKRIKELSKSDIYKIIENWKDDIIDTCINKALNGAKNMIEGDEKVGKLSMERASKVSLVASKANPIQTITVEQFREQYNLQRKRENKNLDQNSKEDIFNNVFGTIVKGIIVEDISLGKNIHSNSTNMVIENIKEQERTEVKKNEQDAR